MTGHRDVFVRLPALAALADSQCGVLSRRQLAGFGLTRDHVACHVRQYRWRPAGPLVLVTHAGPLDEGARRWVAVLGSGPGAALCAWTALATWGVTGWERDTVHVVVARGCDPPDLPSWVGPTRVHISRRHRAADVVRRDGIPVHTVERAAVDAAAWATTDRAGCGVLAAVVQQRLSTPDRLLAALHDAGKVRRHRLLGLALADIAGGSTALSEIDLVRLCRANGLPEPTRQVVRTDSRGRRRYLDATWKRPDGSLVAVEIDGIGHLQAGQWYDDLLRDAEIAGGRGPRATRLPALALRIEQQRVVAILHRLIFG